jgi:hypothetical protein
MLADRFGADIIATPGAIEQMHRNVAMTRREGMIRQQHAGLTGLVVFAG